MTNPILDKIKEIDPDWEITDEQRSQAAIPMTSDYELPRWYDGPHQRHPAKAIAENLPALVLAAREQVARVTGAPISAVRPSDVWHGVRIYKPLNPSYHAVSDWHFLRDLPLERIIELARSSAQRNASAPDLSEEKRALRDAVDTLLAKIA